MPVLLIEVIFHLYLFLPSILTCIFYVYVEPTIKADAVSPSIEVNTYIDDVENMMAAYQQQLAPLLINKSDFVMGEEIGRGMHKILRLKF